MGAACLHAGWNFITRKFRGDLALLWLSIWFGIIVELPLMLYFVDYGKILAATPYIFASAISHGFYVIFLGMSYQFGDISLVYPIARGTGVGLTTLAAGLGGLGESVPPTPGQWGGILCILVGVLTLGLGSRKLNNSEKKSEPQENAAPLDSESLACDAEFGARQMKPDAKETVSEVYRTSSIVLSSISPSSNSDVMHTTQSVASSFSSASTSSCSAVLTSSPLPLEVVHHHVAGPPASSTVVISSSIVTLSGREPTVITTSSTASSAILDTDSSESPPSFLDRQPCCRPLWGFLLSLGANSFFLAFCVGVAISVYSIVDAVGVTKIDPISYLFFCYVQTNLFCMPFILSKYAHLCENALRCHKKEIAFIGAASSGGYMMILFVFQMAPVSAIVALREVSVVIGSVLGMVFLGETCTFIKVASILIIVGGIIMVKVF